MRQELIMIEKRKEEIRYLEQESRISKTKGETHSKKISETGTQVSKVKG